MRQIAILLLTACMPEASTRPTPAPFIPPEPPATPTPPPPSGPVDAGDFEAVFNNRLTPLAQKWEPMVFAMMDWEIAWLNENYALPHDVPIRHELCGHANAYWTGDGITMCYEMLDRLEEAFTPEYDTPEQVEQAVYAAWTFFLYHELGHAFVDVYDLPVPGNEEDAVDALATVQLIEQDYSIGVWYASVYWDISSSDQPYYAGVHSVSQQRYYSLACWAYGSDPQEYANILDWIPELDQRLPGCQNEYQNQVNGWGTLLDPWRL